LFFSLGDFKERSPTGFIKAAKSAADILLIVFASVPFGFTAPVILAFFATVQFFSFFLNHNSFLSALTKNCWDNYIMKGFLFQPEKSAPHVTIDKQYQACIMKIRPSFIGRTG
jgi:hypothetical protein